jgi:putative transposase
LAGSASENGKAVSGVDGSPSAVHGRRHSREVKKLGKKTAAAQIALWVSAPELVWQKRFYDFNVWSERKRIEKLRYMHRNPVKRGLVERPEQWRWSSFRAYCYGERGLVRVNFQEWAVKIRARPVEKFNEESSTPRPLIRKARE